jgi:RNA polymerase sigma-70 factor (ECF subfamily)
MATNSQAVEQTVSGPTGLDEATDERLVEFAQRAATVEERRRAASCLLERYRDRTYIWCLKHLRDHERALDAAQEVLISAYRNLGSFGGRSQFSSWLFAVARNRCLSELRRPVVAIDTETDCDTIADHGGNPEQLLLERQGEEALLQLIATRLQPVEQEALWLRCVEKMPVDTITAALGITESSGARAVLQRARRKLRAALDKRTNEAKGTDRC